MLLKADLDVIFDLIWLCLPDWVIPNLVSEFVFKLMDIQLGWIYEHLFGKI